MNDRRWRGPIRVVAFCGTKIGREGDYSRTTALIDCRAYNSVSVRVSDTGPNSKFNVIAFSCAELRRNNRDAEIMTRHDSLRVRIK